MHIPHKPIKGKITRNEKKIGETIEERVGRLNNNKEPITDGAPLIFTDRSDGVRPEFDVRTDRFELAVEATDKSARAALSKREERLASMHAAEKPGDPGV